MWMPSNSAVSWRKPTQAPRQPQFIWQHCWTRAAGQVARLKDDPGLTPDAPVLTVVTAADGEQGFSIGLDQLPSGIRRCGCRSHDVFVRTLGGTRPSVSPRISPPLKGERVLDRVKREAEATPLQSGPTGGRTSGNSLQWNKPWETSWLGSRGHLVGTVARHGSLYKFGVDRWAGVRPDHASPHKFRFDPPLAGLALGRDSAS